MLKRLRAYCRRHKLITGLALIILLPLFILLLYSAFVLFKASLDTPKVVERATSPDKIALRVEDFGAERLKILLAVEDPNFYSHNGVDLSTPGAGWTTITQGIVKVYFYNGFTPGTFRYRKFEQSLIALVFDRKVDKRTQLLIFINSAYFGDYEGREVIGFQDAARVYLRKEFSDLTTDEFISLVAMLIAPNDINISKNPTKTSERASRIKRLLAGECRPLGLTDVYYESCR